MRTCKAEEIVNMNSQGRVTNLHMLDINSIISLEMVKSDTDQFIMHVLIPEVRYLFESIEAKKDLENSVSVILKSWWLLHVDLHVDFGMKKCAGNIILFSGLSVGGYKM